MRRFVLVCALLAAVGPAQAATSSPPSAGHDDVRAAASRAFGLLVDASASWPDKRTCTSCHHQLLPQNGETTLLHAAQIDFGDTAMVELLVTSGADRSIRGPDQQSALDLARRYGHVGIARVLEGAGAPASSGR